MPARRIAPPPLTPTQQQAVADNVGLAYRMVHRRPAWQRKMMDRDDAYQVALAALIRAVQLFDASRGIAFSTYACKAIIRQLTLHARHQTLVDYPEWLDTERRFWRHQAVAIRDRRSNDYAGQSDRVAHYRPHPASREPSVSEQAHREQVADLAEQFLAQLPARSAEVVRLRYWEGLTLEEIGEKVGVTKERVRQILDVSMRRMRTALFRVMPAGEGQI